MPNDNRPQTIFRVVKCKDNPYFMMDKRPIKNPALSWKAKGILAYLLSCPDGWEVNLTDLINHSTDGRDSVRAGLKELKLAGHCVYKISRSEGKFTQFLIEVHEEPIRVSLPDPTNAAIPVPEKPLVVVSEPLTGIPATDKPLTDNPTQVIKNLSNTSTGASAPRVNFRTPEWDAQHGITPEVPAPEEEYQQKVLNALEYFSHVPHLKGLLLAFVDATGIFPAKSDIGGWTKSLKELYEARLTPQDVLQAVKRMRHDKLTIGSPFSIKKVAIDLHALHITAKPVEVPAYLQRLQSGNYIKPSQLQNKTVDA